EDRDEPVLVTNGVLRVAARFFGDGDLEERNRYSDGRLAVAGMVGGEDESHDAHLGLIELAASVCVVGPPDCGRCPLRRLCAYAAENPYQQSRFSPSRGK